MLECFNPYMSKHTSLRIGGPAIAKLTIESGADLENLNDRLKSLGGKPYCLGKGSNILADDGQLPYVLVNIADRDIAIAKDEHENVLVRAGAGTPLSLLLNFCIRNNLSGLEGLVGIPGTVGGACAMNAGSFGCEIADSLHSITIYGKNGLRIYKREEISPSYRAMVFGNEDNGIILEAIFTLTRKLKNVILEKVHHNFFEKKSRQPIKDWSAGCAFKNPPGTSAGLLIEQAGLKGKTMGGMAFSSKHANFLINEGKGCAAAAFDMLSLAIEKVEKQSGHILETEVKILKC